MISSFELNVSVPFLVFYFWNVDIFEGATSKSKKVQNQKSVRSRTLPARKPFVFPKANSGLILDQVSQMPSFLSWLNRYKILICALSTLSSISYNLDQSYNLKLDLESYCKISRRFWKKNKLCNHFMCSRYTATISI